MTAPHSTEEPPDLKIREVEKSRDQFRVPVQVPRTQQPIVCHLTSRHRWFDERIYQKQAKSLARAGWQVVLVAPAKSREVISGVRIEPLGDAPGMWRRIFRADWQLFRLALREKAAVYHFHDPELIPIGLLLKCLGKRVIYDVHEDYEHTVLAAGWVPRGLRRVASVVWGTFERLTSRAFDYIVVVDSNIRRKFPACKTEMITNVPPLSYSREEPRPMRSGPLRVVYVGKLTEERGANTLIDALNLLRNRDTELHIIGEVDDPKYREMLKAHPQVICHGRLPWPETRSVLESADVGVLLLQPKPKYLGSTGEGYTKIFEYMSLGLPVLFSDFPKLRTLIGGLGAGLAVDPTSPSKIAEAIDRLGDDPVLCHNLGENGRRIMRERFHWELEEKKLLEVYARVLARN